MFSHGKAAVTPRNVEARIVKLETRRQRPKEILLVWRRPDGDLKAAASVAKFGAGDRVICVEWFGEDPPPAPRWHGERLSKELPRQQYDYITRSLQRLVEAEPLRDSGFAPVPFVQANRLVELSDNELLHCAFGVVT